MHLQLLSTPTCFSRPTHNHFFTFYHRWTKILGILYHFHNVLDLDGFLQRQLPLSSDIYTPHPEDGRRRGPKHVGVGNKGHV